MNWDELNLSLGNKLSELGLTGYSTNQQKLLQQYKQGGNCHLTANENDDLIAALVFLSFISAPKMFEGSPRVLWITPKTFDIKQRKDLYQLYTMRGDTTIEIAPDKGKIIEQRNAIFQGTEVLLGNPKRLMELYLQNGFHVNKIHLLIVEGFDEICKENQAYQGVRRIIESLPKCQKLFISTKNHPKMLPLLDETHEFFSELSLESNA
jgi:hypothetical protein